MKRLTKGFLSFIMMTSYALGMSAQDATFVPADYLVRFMKGGKVSGAAKLLCNE